MLLELEHEDEDGVETVEERLEDQKVRVWWVPSVRGLFHLVMLVRPRDEPASARFPLLMTACSSLAAIGSSRLQ